MDVVYLASQFIAGHKNHVAYVMSRENVRRTDIGRFIKQLRSILTINSDQIVGEFVQLYAENMTA